MPTRNEILYTSNGSPIRLGSEIGRGGEGAVYEVEGRTGQAVKLYLAPIDSFKTAKLQIMVRQQTDELTKLTAWPSDLVLKSPKGRVTGLLMRRVTGFRPIHELYTPKSRLREFPRANWPFLIHVAANVARAFRLLHSSGVVIGDVNHGNILVNDFGVCSLIDCDSFQVATHGRKYICEVGVSTYTPPELQSKSLSMIVRTENHDNFGLAVLIFHLLFMGRHPFAGRFAGKGEMPVERAIKECRFAFSAHGKAMQMSPPPNALHLSDLPVSLANLFEQAFSTGAARGAARPGAEPWIEALESLARRLAKCTRTSCHDYYKGLSQCPWCAIERGNALALFFEMDGASLQSDFNLAAAWAKIAAIPAPGPLPVLKRRRDLHRRRAPNRKSGWRNTRKVMVALGGMAATIVLCFLLKLGANASFWIVLTIGCVTIVAGRPRKRSPAELAAALNEASALCKSVEERWQKEATDHAFCWKLRGLEAAKKRLEGLPRMRREGLRRLERERKELQLQKWLDRHSIRDVNLPGVGAGRKALLASYGIDTASDLSWQALQKVNGIGPRNAAALMIWRDSVATRFVFDPGLGADAFDIARLDREISERRITLEQKLHCGVAELEAIRKHILDTRQNLQLTAQNAIAALVHAEECFKTGSRQK